MFQYNKAKRELCLEQIVQGLCMDINKLQVARDKNQEDSMVKKLEESLSYGLQTLAEIMREHLTFRRECILTAFSLTPTQPLYQKIVQLAQESNFKTSESSSKNDTTENDTQNNSWPSGLRLAKEDFDSACQDFIDTLGKGFGTAPTKLRANAVLCEKKPRNLEGLISIQGDLVTEAKNYDPVKAPLKTMSASELGIRKRLVDDLLIMINAPRWHLLSWVLDWPQLEEQCQALLQNPELKRPTKELKYLVIDYTQFDEWSSEEEVTATAVFEKGFENWANASSDDEEVVDEKGLDPKTDIDFNVIPILTEADNLDEDDFDDDNDDYLSPADYLPLAKKPKMEQSFLAVAEEATAASSDLADHRSRTDCLLRSFVSDKVSREEEEVKDEEVRATLQRVVPGLNDLSFARPKIPVQFEVRVVQVNTDKVASTSSTTSTTSTSSSVSSSSTTVVAGGGTASAASNKPERKVQYVYKQGGQTVLIDYPMSEDAYSKLKSNNSGSSNAVGTGGSSSSSNSSTIVVKPQQQPKILMSTSVDTLANSLISQITTPVNVSNPSQNGQQKQSQQQEDEAAKSNSTAAAAATASGALPKFQFAFGPTGSPSGGVAKATSAVTPVEVVSNGGQRQLHVINNSGNTQGVTQRCIVQTLSPAKLQYNTIVRPAAAASTVIQRSPSVSVVVPVVTVEGGSAQTVIANARSVLASQQQQQVVNPPNSGGGNTVVSPQNDNAANADLIRQLNVARAQGDVVLQHWGDKQVLVHKATGRWIMRQGNRLVTVPPQALGITTAPSSVIVTTAATTTRPSEPSSTMISTASSSSSSTGASEEAGNNTVKSVGQTIVRSMSSSTMEQLAEFDSILESKFKSSPSPPAVQLPDVVASSTNNSAATAVIQTSRPTPSGPTFVIITPTSSSTSSAPTAVALSAGGNSFGATSGKNIVAVSNVASLKRSESVEAISPASASKVINGGLKIASASAPSSPVKAVKIQTQTSASASASPIAVSNVAAAASGFVKPPPKPQEDPDTLKRIQQILDDYNEQIRNSPDLQNRPAPRRRTNGPATPGATGGGTTTTPPPPGVVQPSSVSPRKRPSLSSGSPNSSSGSESPLLIHSHSGPDLDAAGSSSVVQLSSSTNFLDSSSQIKVEESKPAGNKPILRQIMVPPALAASLQATGKQLVFITGAGGKKVIAMRPMVQQGSSSSSTTTMVKTARIVAGNSPVTTLNSPSPTPPARVVNLSSSTSVPSPPLAAIVTSASSSPTMASSNPTVCSPSPPSLSSSVEESHRPMTPILGIPMELTPGQIMEAEISASFEDDDVAQPQETPTSTSSGLCLQRDHPDSDLQSDTLPENLFTPDQPLSPTTVHKPPVITEETEVDTDDVEAEDEASSVVSTVMKRKRLVSGGTASSISEAEVATSSPTKRSRQNVVNSATGMRTRQRNLSSHMQKNKSGIIGIATTESSRSSIKK